MIRTAVVGATGYTGEELVRILSNHPGVELTSITAIIERPTKFSDIFPHFKGKVELICNQLDIEQVSKVSDLIFLALPHKVSMEIAPQFLKKGKKVIDMSADYRFQDVGVYKKWYKVAHKDQTNLKNAVYGLPEIYREKIKNANLIANPGCYPTSIILAVLPLIKEKAAGFEYVIADSKSGFTGAGREKLSFDEINENLKAYKVNEHQHAPEINDQLSKVSGKKIEIVFVPHLIPIKRGILSTIYLKLKEGVSEKEIFNIYTNVYKNEPFVRILEKGVFPQIKDVAETNFCDIGMKIDEKENLVILVSAIDNLGKGASSQAIQNMNIMYGFGEKTGLI